MSSDEIKNKLINFIEGQLSAEENALVEKALKEDKELQKEYQELKELFSAMEAQEEYSPDPNMRINFLAAIEEEKVLLKDTKVRSLANPFAKYFLNNWMNMAAAVALLFLGFSFGLWTKNSVDQQQEIAALKEEMEATKQMLITTMKDQQLASSRLDAVNQTRDMQIDEDLLESLIKVVKEDGNLNVKLAALDALKTVKTEQKVKDAMIEILIQQNDPLVQVYVINALTEVEDKRTASTLKKLIKDESTYELVKEEAQLALFKVNKSIF
jgi:anti-sigma-K factor RskA